ncbi:MAG: HPr(Ser) kinase/phosphatase [Waddliaceae bacterium]
MYLVEDLYKRHGHSLGLEFLAGMEGAKRRIKLPEAHRPGLALTGYLKSYTSSRIIICGRNEIEYIRDLDPKLRIKRLEAILKPQTPAVIITRGLRPPKELVDLCNQHSVPLFRATMSTMNLLSKLTLLLMEEFAVSISLHGTLVEVFGVGVLIQGDSSVGKSEAALGLIERGHRLISDDIVKVKKKGGAFLEGSGVELTRHHMEIRGIGIINVANLYGVVCVRDFKSIDLVVKLENWDDEHVYDRVGLDDKYTEILGVKLPLHILPVKPGRNVVLLLETVSLNHRLKKMGYHSARNFTTKLSNFIAYKTKKGNDLRETRKKSANKK